MLPAAGADITLAPLGIQTIRGQRVRAFSVRGPEVEFWREVGRHSVFAQRIATIAVAILAQGTFGLDFGPGPIVGVVTLELQVDHPADGAERR